MIPVLAISAWSGTGKTTLLKKLIPALCAKGIRPGLIKHTHHNMDVDKPGKDSYELRKAGAAQTIVASNQRWALMTETPQEPVSLAYLSQQFDRHLTDLVLVEGFKQEPIPKILLHRQEMTKPLPELDENVLALATDYSLETDRTLLDINHIEQIAEFIYQWWKKTQ